MNKAERIKMVKAMEYIARNLNNEHIFYRWLMTGVADGNIAYGDLSDDPGEAEFYTEDENFFRSDVCISCNHGPSAAVRWSVLR